MTGQISVDWDVEFWARRYPLHYLAIYNREKDRSPAEKLRALWRWKSLHRTSYGPEDVQPFLQEARQLTNEIDGTVADSPTDEVTDAFVELRSQLKSEDGPLSENSRVAVTPQFLLHLADSRDSYSGRFPILDGMVARAYRTHTAEDEDRTLQSALTCSKTSYRQLIEYFFDNCETAEEVATLERALFVQGQSIGRYREDAGEYDEIRKVPVGQAREYLKDIKKHATVQQ